MFSSSKIESAMLQISDVQVRPSGGCMSYAYTHAEICWRMSMLQLPFWAARYLRRQKKSKSILWIAWHIVVACSCLAFFIEINLEGKCCQWLLWQGECWHLGWCVLFSRGAYLERRVRGSTLRGALSFCTKICDGSDVVTFVFCFFWQVLSLFRDRHFDLDRTQNL